MPCHSPDNLPDDWDLYYRTCTFCGGRYHASEGGCGCLDVLEPCQCGSPQWNGTSVKDLRCTKCGTGPFEAKTLQRVSYQVARKPYNVGTPQEIRPGDRYRKVTSRGHYPDGAWGPWVVTRIPT